MHSLRTGTTPSPSRVEDPDQVPCLRTEALRRRFLPPHTESKMRVGGVFPCLRRRKTGVVNAGILYLYTSLHVTTCHVRRGADGHPPTPRSGCYRRGRRRQCCRTRTGLRRPQHPRLEPREVRVRAMARLLLKVVQRYRRWAAPERGWESGLERSGVEPDGAASQRPPGHQTRPPDSWSPNGHCALLRSASGRSLICEPLLSARAGTFREGP